MVAQLPIKIHTGSLFHNGVTLISSRPLPFQYSLSFQYIYISVSSFAFSTRITISFSKHICHARHCRLLKRLYFTYTNLLLTFEHLTEISEWIDKCLSNESEQSTDAKTWVAQFLTYWIRCLSIGYVHEKILISP